MPLELTHLLLLMLCYYPPRQRLERFTLRNSQFDFSKRLFEFHHHGTKAFSFHNILISHTLVRCFEMDWSSRQIQINENLLVRSPHQVREPKMCLNVFSEEALDSKIFVESRFQSHSASAQKIFHSNETRALLWNFAGTAGYFRSCKWKKNMCFYSF